jgi:ATP-dependent DNA ligase
LTATGWWPTKSDGAGQLISRNGRDHTRRFSRLAEALAGLKVKTLTLDGEVAVFDSKLVSRLEWFRSLPKDEPATAPVFIAFDVLDLNGRDLRPKPLRERRRVLERLVSNHKMVFPAAVSISMASRRGRRRWRGATRESWPRTKGEAERLPREGAGASTILSGSSCSTRGL